MINSDGMSKVFDYASLISEIDQFTKNTHYETDEWLNSRILFACASYEAIKAIELFLRKQPVMNNKGELGLLLVVKVNDLGRIRQYKDLQIQ